jgi:hypothetical protein
MRSTPTLMISIVAAALSGACTREDTATPTTAMKVDTTEFDRAAVETPSPSSDDPMKQAPTQLHEPKTTNLTGAEGGQQIVMARCAREERCGHVGGGKKFPSMAHCLVKLTNVHEKTFGAETCPTGVSEAPLRECMDGLTAFACEESLDTIDRLDGCGTAVLCVDS